MRQRGGPFQPFLVLSSERSAVGRPTDLRPYACTMFHHAAPGQTGCTRMNCLSTPRASSRTLPIWLKSGNVHSWPGKLVAMAARAAADSPHSSGMRFERASARMFCSLGTHAK